MGLAYEYVALYILIAVATAAVYFVRKILHYFKDRGIPYEEPHLLLGNMKGFRTTHAMQDMFNDVYRKFKGSGPFCGFFFLQRPMVMVLDKQLAKNVLIKDFSNFADRGMFYNEKDDPLTGHLFSVDGALWRQLRQKLSPTFTSGKMKLMYPTALRVADEFISVFGGLVKPGGSVVEIKDLLARFTTDVIGTCAFGIDCHSLKDPNTEFRVMGAAAFQKNRHNDLLTGFIFSFPRMARRLRMRQVHEDVHQFFMGIVRETVAYREKSAIKRNDFMDLLIELKNGQGLKGEMAGLTVEQLAAQAFVFFLAGFETSSTAMSFALYELARHQDVQDRLREEVTEVLAKHENIFSYECMKEMTYIEQVLSETMRLYTIVPNLQRQALNDYAVPGHPGYVIEKGMGVIIPACSYHHDPEYYPEPEAFKPERFAPEMVASRDSVEFLAFGDGPRNCIGLRFGKMQSRIGLALLIKHFKFSTCEQTQIPLKFNPKTFVLGSEGGIFLRVENL